MIPEHDHNNYNCEIQTENGDRRRVYANWLHNNNLDHWQGWYCEAGLSNFHVDKNFNIWSGECKNELLGNLMTDWQVSTLLTCQQPRCTGCTPDLAVKKHKQVAKL